MIVATQCTISSSIKATKAKGTRSVFTRIQDHIYYGGNSRWSPDTAPIKSKMVYASSKDSIKRSFNGIGTEIQGTDYAEGSYETVLEKVSKGRA